MTYQNIPNDSANTDRKRRLEVMQVKLRSQRPSDIFGAMLEVRKLLQINTEDQEVYEILLDAVRDNSGLRQEIRNLLEEMIQKGSKYAAGALRVLPADIRDLMADADDAYYTADYDEATELYRQVLEKDPTNVRAKEQLAKAELNRIAGMPDTELPRAAIQHFRRARSHIAARDFVAATNLLNAALEEARVRGMEFPEAEKLINSIQNLWTADEYKTKADLALKNEQWGNAWDLYNKAFLLNPYDQVAKELIGGLDNLMRADALLDSLSEQQNSDKERKEKLEKIDAFLKTAEEIKTLVSTSLLKNSRTRYAQYQEKGMKGAIFSKRSQIAIVGLLLFVFGGVTYLIWNSIKQPPQVPGSTSLPTFPITSASTPTFISTLTPTLVVSFTATVPFTPTINVTETTTLTPTIAPVAYGVININAGTNPVDDPLTGKLIFPRLELGQSVNILDLNPVRGYYKCSWEIDGTPYTGWIIKDYIDTVLNTATPGS